MVAPGSTAPAAPGATRSEFGRLADGWTVEAITLANSNGMEARLITYGASIQSVLVPDRRGAIADVALGHATLADYVEHPQYFGATVGRVANRVAKGRFALDGRAYQVPVNNGPNSLHGGTQGFDKVVWEVVRVSEAPTPGVTLRYVSPDGEMGYPGTLTVTATYRLDETNTLSV